MYKYLMQKCIQNMKSHYEYNPHEMYTAIVYNIHTTILYNTIY